MLSFEGYGEALDAWQGASVKAVPTITVSPVFHVCAQSPYRLFAKQRFSPIAGVGIGDIHVDWISAQKDMRIAKMPMGITYARQSLMGSHIAESREDEREVIYAGEILHAVFVPQLRIRSSCRSCIVAHHPSGM